MAKDNSNPFSIDFDSHILQAEPEWRKNGNMQISLEFWETTK